MTSLLLSLATAALVNGTAFAYDEKSATAIEPNPTPAHDNMELQEKAKRAERQKQKPKGPAGRAAKSKMPVEPPVPDMQPVPDVDYKDIKK